MEMLSKIDEGDELQEPLTKAMSVAGLTLKLILGCPYVTEFRKFSPEIEVLQNEIAKAIWLLNKKVRFSELNNLQLLLDPNAKLTNRSLRMAIRNMLTEYLLECSDMDSIPEWLLETLAIINRCSRSAPFRYFSKKEIEKEVECILSVSAQTKQIVWDLSHEHEFDHDFADSYMEDLEESDDGDAYAYDDDDDDDVQLELPEYSTFNSKDLCDQMESIGETNPINSTPQPSTTKGDCYSPVLTTSRKLKVKLESAEITGMNSVNFCGSAPSSSSLEPKVFNTPKSIDGNQNYFGSSRNLGLTDTGSLKMTENKLAYSSAISLNGNAVMKQEPTIDSENTPDFVSSSFSCREANFVNDKQSKDRRNPYLAIQEASDETSLVAYRLIGRMLDEFTQIEGVELDVDELAYLKSNEPNPKKFQVAREKSSCDKHECGSVLIQLVQQLIPSFPQSGKVRLEELMGSR